MINRDKVLMMLLIASGLTLGAWAVPESRAEDPQPVAVERAGIDPEKLHRWNQLTDEQKQRLRERHQQFKNMDPARKEEVRRNWKRFKNLSPE